jgi:hypothetical protein
MAGGVAAAKAEIKLILKALKELNNGTSLEALLHSNQAWVARLGVLQAYPDQATLPELMLLLGTPIAAWPAIQNAAGRERVERSNLLGRFALVRAQSAHQNLPPSTVLGQQLATAKAHRATFHAPTRRAPPQDATQPVPVPPCTHPYIYNYDPRKPQIQQYEDDILGGSGGQGPAEGVPVTLPPALPLPPNVRDALRYTNVYQSWTSAFGMIYDDPTQPALAQALALAASGPQPLVPNYTPIYVMDGANIFNRSQVRWDAKNKCNEQFVQAGSLPGPVIIVMQHHLLVEDILSTKSGVLTDENLKHLDFFLCQLHGWQFPIVILEMQPEQCQDTMQLPDGQGGEFPCLYNDRNKEWPKKLNGDDFRPGEPGFGDPAKQKKKSYCRVWEEEEDKTHGGKTLMHDFCEFDDAIVDQLVERAIHVNGMRAFRVSGDGHVTTFDKRIRIWQEMPRLRDRLRVRLYTVEQRAPVPSESNR